MKVIDGRCPNKAFDFNSNFFLTSFRFYARVSDLLAQSKGETLSAKGEAELERYLTLEHLACLAKTHALAQLQWQP